MKKTDVMKSLSATRPASLKPVDDPERLDRIIAAATTRPSTVSAGADALLTQTASPERVPARRRLLLSPGRALLGLVAAAAAVAVVAPAMLSDNTISVAPQPGTSVSATAGPTARQILLAAAVAAEKAPASGDYWRTATVSQWMLTDPTRSYVLERSRSLETWRAKRPDLQYWRIWQDLGVKPATPQDEAAWRAAGAPTSWRYPKNMKTENLFSVPFKPLKAAAGERTAERLYGKWKGSAGDLAGKSLTWKEVRAIPGEPEALRSYLEERIGRLELTGSMMDVEEARAYILLRDCVDIISGLPASPEVHASAYRILASLPGIRAEGEMTDPLGRRGQTLTYQEEIEPGLFSKVQLVVDPSTGLLLAEVRTNTTKLANGRQAELRLSTSFRAIGWTDERPELPTHRN
ncbi:CU044_5270 family protein [Planomonospora sp. ID67723]|uniref:CU044_5270 family protein n=1 Tax=Planomonospora sp. ID67723 TaxID=2738134 RepID=UPI0018C3CA32|nr:CU044_5270 family protein [Planomonospora sp. ID67723]MBG0828228.1 CU044_5270 family protein [Planomonospora sp. ID67723]